MNTVLSFATVDPESMSEAKPGHAFNLSNGAWWAANTPRVIPDPMNGKGFLMVPATAANEFNPFLSGLESCPKSGVHNPIKNVERYRMLGAVSARAAVALTHPDVAKFFARLIQRVMPKSFAQCMGEVAVTQKFLENFSGDQPRFLATGFSVPGDHFGQESRGYRWPYGPVVIVAPFNFPIEIPALQLMSALYMGNRPLIKVDSKVSIVVEQFIRLLHACGLPMEDVDLIHCTGETMGEFITQARRSIRLVQFTGSSTIAEQVSQIMGGRVKIEDAGFDWKILGPTSRLTDWLDYVAWQCDQDAYAASGQKCSAESILFAHRDWITAGIVRKLKELAERRRIDDLTIGPVLTWTTDAMLKHVKDLCELDGAQLLFGGEPLSGHNIPECYGAIQPTAISIPLASMLHPFAFPLVTTEVFGPIHVIVEFGDDEVDNVLQAMECMTNHLTAAVVSDDEQFTSRIVGASVNGTTYVGMRARTTGAPQNHWFGPTGDPRAAGIGTPGAIISTWSSHREIIRDIGPIPTNWKIPAAS